MFRSHDISGSRLHGEHGPRTLHGDVTYFNVNRHINPTDVCVASCRLCAFGKKAKDPNSYTMSLEQVWEIAGKGYAEAVTEFHIVGGLHPELTLDWFCEMIAGLKERYPGVHLKAFTMVEIAYFAKRAKISIRETLRAAERLPAWIPCPAAARRFFQSACAGSSAITRSTATNGWKPRAWRIEIGLKSNCTMLYGHLETAEDRVGPSGALARVAG